MSRLSCEDPDGSDQLWDELLQTDPLSPAEGEKGADGGVDSSHPVVNQGLELSAISLSNSCRNVLFFHRHFSAETLTHYKTNT